MKVTYDRYSLLIDGKREFILSGAIHYYRLPSQIIWRDRLRKMKEAGLNAVDVYFAWNYHSPAEGEYDFEGIRDVDALMDMIGDEGLYLIARPGPYICSEVDGGGFPGWLVRRPGVVLRCRRPGRAAYCAEYMKHVAQWWEQIVPRIAERKNLILFQIENEYNLVPLRGPLKAASDTLMKWSPDLLFEIASSDPFNWAMFKAAPRLGREARKKHRPSRYMQELYGMSRKLGIDVPIFHNDIASFSERQRDVDIMAVDNYAIMSFRSDWRDRRNTFYGIDIIEECHDEYGKEDPIFIAEFQGGWYDSWGMRGYDNTRRMLGADQLDIATKSALAQRATLINYFMFCGGTTWGYLGSPDVYTSYDMAAPVREDGRRSERYYAVKWLAGVIDDLGADFLRTDPDPEITADDRDVFCRARRSLMRRYVFLRNPLRARREVWVAGLQRRIGLEPLEMKLLVLDDGNRLVREVGAHAPVAGEEIEPVGLPELADWRFARLGEILEPGYDDSGWDEIPFGGAMDIDSLGFHYGFVWYRGTYRGKISRIVLDARHCYSVFVNGELVGSEDGFENKTGVGTDFGFMREFRIPKVHQDRNPNVIVVLVESLGHTKDFQCDADQPRGIVRQSVFGAHVRWRARGGLVDGERGMCPVVPRESFTEVGGEAVSLPHEWGAGQGVGVYQTEFDLDETHGADPMRPVHLVFSHAHEKANVYLNGYLVGRYWEGVGPQKRFYLPPGILQTCGHNHLAVAVWRRAERSGLGEMRLE
ncbi:MAG: beta-galactosidase [bacterium]